MSETRDIQHLFSMIGATPNTAWLNGCVPVDGKGFVKTGIDLQPADLTAARWPLARSPYPLETALPAVALSHAHPRSAIAVGRGLHEMFTWSLSEANETVLDTLDRRASRRARCAVTQFTEETQ